MTRPRKRILICAAIVAGSVAATIQMYYADAIRAAALGGARKMALDQFFTKSVARYEGDNDRILAQASLRHFGSCPSSALSFDPLRTVKAAAEMVREVIGEFRTGAGLHSGEVVIGNVGSSDKLEFTVLGSTVNLASRLESLNKDQILGY
jgi:class 3 adenylate cyclase